MTLTEFLLARIAEDEAEAQERGDAFWYEGGWTLDHETRVLAEVEAKRRIVEWHKSWPVLVESQPTFDPTDASDVNTMTFRMSKQIAWTTEQQYRECFGTEPPTGPILCIMAAVYSDHPDYDEAWRA